MYKLMAIKLSLLTVLVQTVANAVCAIRAWTSLRTLAGVIVHANIEIAELALVLAAVGDGAVI